MNFFSEDVSGGIEQSVNIGKKYEKNQNAIISIIPHKMKQKKDEEIKNQNARESGIKVAEAIRLPDGF